MHFRYATIASISSLLALAGASPAPLADSQLITLDSAAGPVDVAIPAPMTPRSLDSSLQARGDNIDCKGSTFCERLSDCDGAKRRVVSENTYSTGKDKGQTGTCSGTCGLFVSGHDCSFTGADLLTAYEDIRHQGCTKCGRKQFVDSGCYIKIDRVTGC